MTRFEANLLHVANVLVGGTGLVYAWMLWFQTPEDPYAVVNHPLQPQVQHLHVLTAPLLVFGCGLIWQAHVWARIRSGYATHRKSGLAVALSLVPMIVSGYLIQVAVDERWRSAWVTVHVATSFVWLAAYLAHQWSASRRRGSASRRRTAAEA